MKEAAGAFALASWMDMETATGTKRRMMDERSKITDQSKTVNEEQEKSKLQVDLKENIRTHREKGKRFLRQAIFVASCCIFADPETDEVGGA